MQLHFMFIKQSVAIVIKSRNVNVKAKMYHVRNKHNFVHFMLILLFLAAVAARQMVRILCVPSQRFHVVW